MSEKQYLSNFSYIFIPFYFEKEEHFYSFNDNLKKSYTWAPIDDEIRYLHRYVSDRLVNTNNGKTNLNHYRLCNNNEVCSTDRFYKTSPKTFKGQENVTFDFQISDVQLFSFNTTICIMAFQLQFQNDDPLQIAAAQYYLRKISTERIYTITDSGKENSFSFIDLSKKLLGNLVEKYELDFFFYATPQNERANFFTYIDMPSKKDYSEELFFLKWCYHDGFVFEDDSEEDDSIDYVASKNTVWGISPSAAVCLVSRCDQNKNFIENVFQKNIQKQYLFTYILLLHQKYMMYLFLTKISVGIDNDLDLLENYKRRLYEFETKYMFSKVSEVPQYQRFYDKVAHCFFLKEMFQDVQEPLSRLTELQRQVSEERQRKYDNGINAALMTLSMLTIVSAVTDASGITNNLEWLFSPQISKIIQISMVTLVLLVSVLMIIRLFFLKNKR